MPNQPDLIIVDRAKLDKFLAGTFPNSPSVRADIIDEWIEKSTPSGVTPNRLPRGETLVKQAVRLHKMLDIELDTMLEMLVHTTDVWDRQSKMRRELLGTYRQLKKFIGEQLEAKHGMASFPREDEMEMQKTLWNLTTRLEQLEREEEQEAENVMRMVMGR